MKTIPVAYSPAMSVEFKSFSPSARKPMLAVTDWRAHLLPIDTRDVRPMSVDLLRKVHDPAYVDGVLAGTRSNGFGNRDIAVANTLLYTNNAMHTAALLALHNGKVACAPVSGFHHACYANGGGFCTFNGLMATAVSLLDIDKKTAILDLDMHYGNGTQNIIERLNLHAFVSQWSDSFYADQAETFLDELAMSVEKLVDGADILLYQAGADSHIDDPLGGYLTSEQMRRRDRIVFQTCKRLGVPVAWNLAGGYQVDADGSIDKVLALHRATMEECIACYVSDQER